ncbi:MAG: sulfide/dihydroorotate dehydrogenase-like FAD/NAD-binding protein [Candidatus Omnitrophota bacterium]|nr:MAG: sulfide/dihydroorotate dehydrogenase-like FAD/NAD-binding protein [Candidatus Omnitrophota bacterium]RKY45749.1 MAG: sulfide/dihydroorotate dehydrogenase-like FAD/NAD-binding protein [Candidatus Omnitrophota bacterium]
MKIINKRVLAKVGKLRIVELEIVSFIANKVKPGQFIVVMVNEKGERIPLTVAKKDLKRKRITVIFQEVGFTTKLLGNLKKGETLYALLGPLGNPTEIRHFGRVILIGGGVGTVEMYPIAEALKKEGNHITTLIGAKTKELLVLKEEFRKISDKITFVTQDGSYGKKGMVTTILENLLKKNYYDFAYTVGPVPMMKKVAYITKKFSLRTVASLTTLMVDATGMCGVCRVSVGNKTKFSCIEGPEFDAHLINWEELENKLKMYRKKEKYICKLHKLC